MPRRPAHESSTPVLGAEVPRPGVARSRYAVRRGVPVRLTARPRDPIGARPPRGGVAPTVELVPVGFGPVTIVVEHTPTGATLHIAGDGLALRLDGNHAEVDWFGQLLAGHARARL